MSHNGDFTSNHQGYAVIKEEIEEVSEELDDMVESLAKIWCSIRYHHPAAISVLDLYLSSVETMKEAMQVGAMAKKYAMKYYPEIMPNIEKIIEEG
jgi:hypothetical protein